MIDKTDPNRIFVPLICGVNVASLAEYGGASIGCFIEVDGKGEIKLPAGNYLLTNLHILKPEESDLVVQPSTVWRKPYNTVGTYRAGLLDPSHDCAFVELLEQRFVNEIPNAPWHPGRRRLTGLSVGQLHDKVCKFGAATGYTTGEIIETNYRSSDGKIQGAFVIRGTDGKVWTAPGDSGSVLVREKDDKVIGLNFAAKPGTIVPGHNDGYSEGFAYDIDTQIWRFGGKGLAVSTP